MSRLYLSVLFISYPPVLAAVRTRSRLSGPRVVVQPGQHLAHRVIDLQEVRI